VLKEYPRFETPSLPSVLAEATTAPDIGDRSHLIYLLLELCDCLPTAVLDVVAMASSSQHPLSPPLPWAPFSPATAPASCHQYSLLSIRWRLLLLVARHKPEMLLVAAATATQQHCNSCSTAIAAASVLHLRKSRKSLGIWGWWVENRGWRIGDRGSNAAPISSQCLCRLCEISAAHVENVFAALLLLPLFVVLLLSARQRFVYGIGGHWSAIGCRLSLKSLHSDRRAAIK